MERPLIICAADLTHAPKARQILEDAFEVQYVSPDADTVEQSLKKADAYLACLQVQLTEEIINQARQLKVIVTPSTGLDHIDIEAATKARIKVLSLKDDRRLLDRITATAELAWALVLACSRRLPLAVATAKNGVWARDNLRGHQIAFKTLGILGCGRLGTIVAGYAHAFRMRVIACDKIKINLPYIEQVSFDDLLSQSDILSIHIHLTEKNRGIMDQKAFAQMKTGAVLVNTSRGAIIDEQAMLEALKSGKLSAAGLDVIDGEWMKDLRNHPLIQYMQNHDNLIITPHIGGVTYESQQMAFEAASLKLVDYLASSY